MQKKINIRNNQGQKLVGILNIPKGKPPFPAVIICHGLSSSKDSGYRKKINQFLEQFKIVALRFDLAGHGESQGKFAEVTVSQGIKDIEAALKYLKSLEFIDKKRFGLMGVSLSGGQIPFIAAKDKSIKAVVLFAPAIDFPTIRLERWKKQKFEDWKRNGFIWYKPKMKLNYSFHLDSKKRVGYKIAPQIKAATLVIQGDKDDVVPLRYVKNFFSKLKSIKKLAVIKNGGHNITDMPYENQVINLTVSWFKKYL